MSQRVTTFAGVLTAALVMMATVPAPLQAQAGPAPSAGPRTPWGDPDLQGNYTNLWEAGTPFERPDQFAGRSLEDVKGDELAAIRRGIQERTRTEQLAGDIGGTRWIWLDSHDHAKGSMAWFVVDPPDGKIPPLRHASGAAAGRPTPTPIAACTIAASRAACLAR
jgi:hypothetical protein